MGTGDGYIAPLALPFKPGTVTWRVNLEPGLMLGGGRALLLQVAHPLVAAGVAQHSDYQSDPWARLARTLDVMFKMAFADPAVSRRQSETLDATHRRVTGTSSDGVAYRALDPALLVWVWATLVDSALVVYERCYGRLGTVDRERFYQEQKLIAYGCGVPEGACPERLADFESYFAGVVETELRVTPEARAVSDAISRPPLRRPLGPLAAGPLNLVTAGLLPPSVRHDYGLVWSDERERLLTAFFAIVGLVARVVPRPLRQLPGLYAVQRTKPLMPPRFLRAEKAGPARKTTAA